MKKLSSVLLAGFVLFASVLACSTINISKIQPSGDLSGYVLLKDGKKITFNQAFISVDGKVLRINSTLVRQTLLLENVASFSFSKDKNKK